MGNTIVEEKGEASITMKEMLETIQKAEILQNKEWNNPSLQEIAEYSPTGEIYKIFDWYAIACKVLGKENIIE